MAAALSASQLRCAKLEEREAELEARLEQAAEREAQQTKEMDELHAANARIAKLAFAQVGSGEGRESETGRNQGGEERSYEGGARGDQGGETGVNGKERKWGGKGETTGEGGS